MNEQAKDTWIPLSVRYRIDPEAVPQDLLDDAVIWLDYAHGIAHSLGEAIHQMDEINADRLSSAMFGVATLIDMSRRCTAHAQRCMQVW